MFVIMKIRISNLQQGSSTAVHAGSLSVRFEMHGASQLLEKPTGQNMTLAFLLQCFVIFISHSPKAFYTH